MCYNLFGGFMIQINSLDHNGCGIGRLDNKVVFVRNALPGEIVDIKIINDKKKFTEASVSKYIKKSSKRIDSPCPYFDVCGGCDIMHMSYSDQLLFKQNKIENIVNKYLSNNIKINKIVESSNNFGYRNKTTFQVKEKLGLYKNKSYEIVPIDECLISNRLINDSIKYLNKLELDKIFKIICRVGSNELMIIIETNDENININCIKDIASSIYLKINSEYKLVYGNEYIYENIDRYKYLVSPDSFFQINLDTCTKLYNNIKDYVGTGKNVLDLYCGTGSIGIFVSENNIVLGIEINKYAIDDALKNKKINNVKNIDFICGDSGKMIDNLDFNPDVVIVDPPRSGLDKNTISNIIKIKSKELIYVSCDPMTFVRDLKILNEYYDIKEITPFDMFPNTKHVECLTILSLK